MVDFKPSHFLYPFSILSFKRRLERSSKQSRRDLISRQDKDLRDLIAYTAAHVPFYRRFFHSSGIRPEDVQTQADLEVLPIVTKQMIRENFDDFVSDVHRRYHPHLVGTSGSTGNAFQLYVGKDSKAAIFALMWHGWGINGYRPYDRWMNFKGYPFPDRELMKYSFAANCIGIPCCVITDEVADRIFERLVTFKPKHIMGYPSFIYDFCNHFKGNGALRALGLRQITTSSEMLYDFQREAIQEAFGCKVFSIYHQVEQVCFIFECEHQVKHLAHEYGVLEVIGSDGKPVEPGNTGSMVCTGFYNRSMPFVRYRLDDLIRVSASPVACLCGRPHQVIDSLEGRGSDVVISRRGHRYNHMNCAFHDKFGLSGMQIVQNELGTLQIRLVQNPFWSESKEAELLDSIKEYTQGEFELQIQYVAKLDKASNGKQRLVVSSLSEEYL